MSTAPVLAWESEILTRHRWGRYGPRAEEERLRLRALWDAAQPLSPGAEAVAGQIVQLEVCNWALEPSIVALCAAIGQLTPTTLSIGHMGSVTGARWRELWALYAALRRWLPHEGASGYGALLAATDAAGDAEARVARLLGERTPLKELYVQRFCLTLAFWLDGFSPEGSPQALAHEAAVQAVEARIKALDPTGAILRALIHEGDGGLQPCHHKALRRYEIILSSIGAGAWRAAMPVRGTDGFERAALVERHLAPIQDWLAGHTRAGGDALYRQLQMALDEPTPAKRFLAALLDSLLRAQAQRARDIAGR